MAVRVRGDCPKCLKPVETNAPRNRVTWRGKCPTTPGCDGVVLARRIKGDVDKPPPEKSAKPPADQTTPPAPRRSKITKVTNARREQQPAGGTAPRVPPAPPRPGRPLDGEQPRVDPQRRDEPGRGGQPGAEPTGRRPTRADRVESGATGRRPYAHLGY